MTRLLPLCLIGLVGLTACAAPHWVASWAASPQRADTDQPVLHLQHQTLREKLHVSLGGTRLRVRLTNLYGTAPLTIGAAHVALAADGTAIDPSSDRRVTFGGQPEVTVAAGATVTSDPVELAVPARGDVALSLYLPSADVVTEHALPSATSFLADGDVASAVALPSAAPLRSWLFTAGLDVTAPAAARTVVAFGDSITDGMRSTIDANRRWPDRLAVRTAPSIAVVNAGIAGNRLLDELVGDAGLSRFDRDVLAQPGVRYVIAAIGINDVGAIDGPGARAESVIAGLQTLVARAHQHGVRFIGATLLPVRGSRLYTPDAEAERQKVNAWIRRAPLDGMVDFDRALRDPADPTQLAPQYASSDHVHPNDAGYQALADAIPLTLFR